MHDRSCSVPWTGCRAATGRRASSPCRRWWTASWTCWRRGSRFRNV